MTAIEALAQVCTEQGFLVMNSRTVREIGEIINQPANVYVRTPTG